MSTHLCTSSVPPLEPSTCQHKSVVDLYVEKYECTEGNNAKHHGLKYIHIIFYVYFTIPENENTNLNENIEYLIIRIS